MSSCGTASHSPKTWAQIAATAFLTGLFGLGPSIAVIVTIGLFNMNHLHSVREELKAAKEEAHKDRLRFWMAFRSLENDIKRVVEVNNGQP